LPAGDAREKHGGSGGGETEKSATGKFHRELFE